MIIQELHINNNKFRILRDKHKIEHLREKMIIIRIIKNYIKKNHIGQKDKRECVHWIVKWLEIILKDNLENLNEISKIYF